METAIKTIAQTQQEWLSNRSGKIGGSTISAILGLDDYRTPVDVWMDLTGKSEKKNTGNKATLRGQMMEQTVANFFELETGLKIIKASVTNEFYIHKNYPYIVASPDRRYWKDSGEKAILECKTTRLMFDEIPDKWFIQLMWYLGLTGCESGTVAWLQTYSEDFKYKEFEFKKEFFDYLINEAVTFWDKYVIPDTPPPIAKAKDVEKLYRKHVMGKTVRVPENKIPLYIRYGELTEQLSKLEKEKKQIQDEMKLLIGDAEGAEFEGKILFTYKAGNDKTVFDAEAFAAAHPELYAQFLKTKPGNRTFLRKK
jgi:putative phage-type endonuclease